MAITIEKENQVKELQDHVHRNGNTTEEEIVEMMLSSVHNIKGKLIEIEKKLIKACSS